jgi:hypothetical protein
MNPKSPSSARGASLLLVMMVLLAMTLLVAGAIAFTGNERSAAAVHTQTAVHSGCAQAARNLFLSRLRVLQRNIQEVQMDEDVTLSDGRQMNVQLGHYTGSSAISFTNINKLPKKLAGGPVDLTNRMTGAGGAGSAGYYSVHAVCRESNGAEQEVEFLVSVNF